MSFVDAELRFTAINTERANLNGGPVEAHFGRTIGEAISEIADVLEPL